MACTGLMLSSINSGSRTETGLGLSGTSEPPSKSPTPFPGVTEVEWDAEGDGGDWFSSDKP